MSNSIAAAKRRRAGIQSSTPDVTASPQANLSNNQPTNPKLSIQNFVVLLDKRISTLEESIKSNTEPNNIKLELETPEGKKVMKITEYMEEMDTKFNMLAEEIMNMKDIVLKLQSFTMEVNKSLVSSQSLKDILSPEKGVTPDIENVESNSNKKEKVTEKPAEKA
jgi:hypothetical protein